MPRTTKTLSKNLEKLTTTPKAKAKTSTGSRSKKKQSETIKVMNSRKIEFFPWIETFPIYLHDQSDNKKCWFTCLEYAQKYVDRYKPKYKCYCYTGGKR